MEESQNTLNLALNSSQTMASQERLNATVLSSISQISLLTLISSKLEKVVRNVM
jgi:hypothetical protein